MCRLTICKLFKPNFEEAVRLNQKVPKVTKNTMNYRKDQKYTRMYVQVPARTKEYQKVTTKYEKSQTTNNKIPTSSKEYQKSTKIKITTLGWEKRQKVGQLPYKIAHHNGSQEGARHILLSRLYQIFICC